MSRKSTATVKKIAAKTVGEKPPRKVSKIVPPPTPEEARRKRLEKIDDTLAVGAVMKCIPALKSRVLHKAVRHARLFQIKEDERLAAHPELLVEQD